MQRKQILVLTILILSTLIGVIALPSIETTNNSNEHDHEDDLDGSYIPCECGHSGCTRNLFSCPCCGFGNPRPFTLYQPQMDGDEGIVLQWSSSYGATSYKVYRSDSEFGTYILITTTSGLTFTDYPSGGGTYWYQVRAYNSNGWTGSNKVSCAFTPPPDFAEGFLYAQSSTYHTWMGEFICEDVEAAITSVDTPGEYLVIYTAQYFGRYGGGGYGWVSLVTDDGEITRTERFFENIALDGYSTMVVADKVMLGTGGVRARLHFFQGPEFKLMERSNNIK